jgi:hypothetical protein
LGIHDGPAGPPIVQLTDGGIIGGYVTVRGASHLLMTGGQIQALTDVCEQATLTMIGGSIEPRIRSYAAADPGTLVRLSDSATLHIRGGLLLPRTVHQEDMSQVHIYGHSFLVDGLPFMDASPSFGYQFQGIFANGQPFDIFVGHPPTSAGVFLHLVPEPPSLALFFVALSFLWRLSCVTL